MAEIQEQQIRPSGGLVVNPIGVVKYAAATDLSGGTDGAYTTLQVDASGNLRTSGSATLTGSTTGAAIPATAIFVAGSDGTNVQALKTDTSGRQVVVGAAATGAAVAGNPVLAGGSDGTNAQALKTDTSGRPIAVGAAATGAAVAGNPVLVGGSDGTNAQAMKTDTSGRPIIAGAGAAGAAVVGNPILVGGSDGTNAQAMKTDTSGRVVVQLVGPAGVAQQNAASDAVSTAVIAATPVYVYNGSGWDRLNSPNNSPLGGGRACTALGSGTLTQLSAVTVTGAGTARDWGVMHNNWTVQITGTSAGLVVALQGSMDNATWVNLTPDGTDGGTISTNTMTANGLYYFRSRGVRYTRLNVTALTSGNVTAITCGY